MTSISQTIPSLTGGISQQPDELMLPGQVKNLVNALPDITDGLVKRNGSRFIDSLSGATSTGAWFSYYRDESEGAYIGQVQTDGSVNIWKVSDPSVSISVTNNVSSYLATAATNLKFLTVNDYTFVTNTTKTVTMDTTTATDKLHPYYAFVELRQLQHGREYNLNIFNSSATETVLTGSGKGKATLIQLDDSYTIAYPTISRRDSLTGISPSLPDQGTEVYIEDETGSGATGKNLAFRITNTGQVQIQEGASGSIEADDYVGVYNPTIELLNGGYGWAVNDTVDVTLKGVTYRVKVLEIQEIKLKQNIGVFRPKPTTFNGNMTLSAEDILSQATSSDLGVTVERVGNGLYLSSSSEFTVGTSQPDLWRILGQTVNDTSLLPSQCKHGYIATVSNSQVASEEDYYLRFVGDNGISGVGTWEEVAEPGIKIRIDNSKLPVTIRRSGVNAFVVDTFKLQAEDGTFSISAWSDRAAGDDDTNPLPSFIGNKISQTFFHRNRLGFLSNGNVILSAAGDLGRFFNQTALLVNPNDPIDIAASSTEPTVFLDSIETNTGLVIFAETQQFLLHTDSDNLSPNTGKLSNISTYRYSPDASPISLGTTIAFLDNAGVKGRFFEMFDVRREGEPQIIEQTKSVPALLPNDIDVVSNSRENNTVFFVKTGAADIYGYRYYNTGERRVQSAWFKWTLPHNIEYCFVLDDSFYVVSSDFKLLEIVLQNKDSLRTVSGDDFYGTDSSFDYRIHLDSSRTITAGSYDADTGETTVTWSNAVGTGTAAVVNTSTGAVYVQASKSGSTYKFNGDFNGQSVVIGFLFDMSVELPKLFVKKKSDQVVVADTTAALTIQRVNFRFGPVGQIDVELKRLGKSSFTNTFDAAFLDSYDAGEAPFIPERTVSVPVYERNHNCNVILKSSHPGPASVRSLTWEGDYTQMFHRRV
tara:strand:- start:1013 stop:3799 length:2787 start_codon:yes stop_codon:yes gene_type:complete